MLPAGPGTQGFLPHRLFAISCSLSLPLQLHCTPSLPQLSHLLLSAACPNPLDDSLLIQMANLF